MVNPIRSSDRLLLDLIEAASQRRARAADDDATAIFPLPPHEGSRVGSNSTGAVAASESGPASLQSNLVRAKFDSAIFELNVQGLLGGAHTADLKEAVSKYKQNGID
jgi:hypothetical protein